MELEMSLQMGLDYHKEYRGEQSEETGLVFQSEQKKANYCYFEMYLALARWKSSVNDNENALVYAKSAVNIFQIVGKNNLKAAKLFMKSLPSEHFEK
eukprot:UN24268